MRCDAVWARFCNRTDSLVTVVNSSHHLSAPVYIFSMACFPTQLTLQLVEMQLEKLSLSSIDAIWAAW